MVAVKGSCCFLNSDLCPKFGVYKQKSSSSRKQSFLVTILVEESRKGNLMYPKTRGWCRLASVVLWPSGSVGQNEQSSELQHEMVKQRF